MFKYFSNIYIRMNRTRNLILSKLFNKNCINSIIIRKILQLYLIDESEVDYVMIDDRSLYESSYLYKTKNEYVLDFELIT